jgi:hypothetical protein
VDAPSGTSGEIVIPFAGETTALTLNGAVVWSHGSPRIDGAWEQPDGIHLAVTGGGSYRLQVMRTCEAGE